MRSAGFAPPPRSSRDWRGRSPVYPRRGDERRDCAPPRASLQTPHRHPPLPLECHGARARPRAPGRSAGPPRSKHAAVPPNPHRQKQLRRHACPDAKAGDRFAVRLTSASIVAILFDMLETRTATAADAHLITHHRRRMFVDAGRADNQVLGVMSRNFEPWVAKMITEGKYFGWL